MGALWRRFVSMRATLAILLVLAILLFLNIVVPQDGGTTVARHAQLVGQGPVPRFLLVTLGFGRMPTSPVFLGVLGLFFANLLGVLLHRTASAARRAGLRPPSVEQARTWLARPETVTCARGAFDPRAASRILGRLRYRVEPLDEGILWALKNRTASLGFLLFHASFLVLCAGGTLLAYTRSVTDVTAIEGQSFDATGGTVLRRGAVHPAPRPTIACERIDVALERGLPVGLRATLRMEEAGAVSQTAEVNRPAEWDSLSVLVERAGVAPVLWLRDASGFTVERVVVAARNQGDRPVEARLGGGRLTVRLRPIPVGERFPTREQLATVPIWMELERAGEGRVQRELRPGERVLLGDLTLSLQEVRYWAGLRLVDERGGGWLILGFVLAVVGISWRMLWYRRELVVAWDEELLRLSGQGEFFPRWFAEELDGIRSLLVDPPNEELR